MRILLVEDEVKVARFVKKGLEEQGHVVDVAGDGEIGLDFALQRSYQVIILDINLPRMDGLEVLRRLRQQRLLTPVLLLTVRSTIEDKVFGLEHGADDYLAKPFSFRELLARVNALARRSQAAELPELRLADLVLDPATHSVVRGGQQIELTAKEFALLSYFMRNPGRVLSRTMIADNVWGYDFDSGTNVIDVYVNYLRKKIDVGFSTRLIHTVRGVGYVLKVE